MSAEDRLREILHSHAETVVPGGEGLAMIQERIEGRRLSRWLLPAGAVAVAGAVAAAVVLTSGGTPTHKLIQTPTTQSPTAAPTTAPPPSMEPTPVPASYGGPAIWPFRSQAQADAWRADHGSKPWAGQAGQVATHFVHDYLKLNPAGLRVSGPDHDLRLATAGHYLGTAHLEQYGSGGPWTVVGVGGTDLTITTPRAGQLVTSPLSVSGRITGVDEHVKLQLITFSGVEVATGGAQAGSAVPWQGSLAWTTGGWTTGAVIGTTYSAKDGSLTRIVAVPVRRK